MFHAQQCSANRQPTRTRFALGLLLLLTATAVAHAQAPGDANCDGSVDASDFAAVSQATFAGTPGACPGADVNADGLVNATDFAALARIVAPPPIGPTLTYFGLANAEGVAIGIAGYSNGVPVFARRVGSGFQIVVEARAGISGRAPGLVTYDPNTHDPSHRPDLQVVASNTLGDGSRDVCLGGVPAVSPPDFGPSQRVADALNDLGCNFVLSAQGSCTMTEFGQPAFLGAGTQAQFCLLVPRSLLLPGGDTLLSVRLRDAAGNLGPMQQIIVRVTPDAGSTLTPPSTIRATPTRTATRMPPTRSASPTRTVVITRTPTGTRTVPPNSPTRTPTRTSTAASATPTPTSRTILPSATPTRTATISPTHFGPTLTPTSTPSRTRTPSRTPSPTLTPTLLVGSPTRTATRTPTQTATVSIRQPTLTATPTVKTTSSRTASATRTPTATRTSTATRTPSFTPTLTVTPTPTKVLSATPTRTRTLTRTITLTPTRTPSGVIGPVVTYFGLTRADDTLVDPIGVTPAGLPIYTRAAGAGFSIIVEGRPGLNNKRVGPSSFDDTGHDFPDLQVVASNTLGNGSIDVCDRVSPNAGGVPALDPPTFEPTQTNIDIVNDFACRFVDGNDRPIGRTGDACVLFESGDFGFAGVGSTTQFCGFIDGVLHFPNGDTVVTARLRDVDGHVGPPAQIVLRIGP